MITIKKKLSFFKITERWFEYSFRLSDLFFPVIYKDVIKLDQPFYFGIKDYDYSAELSLEQSVDQILSSFRSRIKTEIHRAEKEGIQCYFHDDIDGFIEFYNDFAASKNLDPANKKRLTEFGTHLKISFAVLNGDILAAHNYLEDKELSIARLFHSGSKRFNENYDRSLIARANKLLHLKDMLYFKEQGIKTYDFGSYQVEEGAKGLLEFKQSMGGKAVTRIFFKTYSYYLLSKLQQLLQAVKK